MKRIALLAGVCALAAVCAAAEADIVTDWNMTTLMINPSMGTLPGGRNLAMVHTAIYDTVMAFDGSYAPYYVTSTAPAGASMDAAATSAAYKVLSTVFSPPALSSAAYAASYETTRLLGASDSASRTSDQAAAYFWAEHVPAHWHRLARDISGREGLSMVENARLFALLSATMADANIAGWNMKYEYSFWRPITAITLGDADTNDDTVGYPAWTPLIATPAFPAYVSGHSILSGAAAELLELYFGRTDYDFTFILMSDPTVTRSYSDFWEAANEAGMSRIWGGIHFDFENTDGLLAGQQLADYVYSTVMTPEPATLALVALGAAALLRRRRTA
jgi:hypothetical protein